MHKFRLRQTYMEYESELFKIPKGPKGAASGDGGPIVSVSMDEELRELFGDISDLSPEADGSNLKCLGLKI